MDSCKNRSVPKQGSRTDKGCGFKYNSSLANVVTYLARLQVITMINLSDGFAIDCDTDGITIRECLNPEDLIQATISKLRSYGRKPSLTVTRNHWTLLSGLKKHRVSLPVVGKGILTATINDIKITGYIVSQKTIPRAVLAAVKRVLSGITDYIVCNQVHPKVLTSNGWIPFCVERQAFAERNLRYDCKVVPNYTTRMG